MDKNVTKREFDWTYIIPTLLIVLVIFTGLYIYFDFSTIFEDHDFCSDKGYDFPDYFEKEGKITCISYYQGERFAEEFNVERTLFGLREVVNE